MPIGCYGLYGPYLYDYHLNYPAHKCVSINSNQCECLALSEYVWQSEYLHEYVLAYIQVYLDFLIFITQIIFIVFFCGQINHLYDV